MIYFYPKDVIRAKDIADFLVDECYLDKKPAKNAARRITKALPDTVHTYEQMQNELKHIAKRFPWILQEAGVLPPEWNCEAPKQRVTVCFGYREFGDDFEYALSSIAKDLECWMLKVLIPVRTKYLSELTNASYQYGCRFGERVSKVEELINGYVNPKLRHLTLYFAEQIAHELWDPNPAPERIAQVLQSMGATDSVDLRKKILEITTKD